MKVGDTMGKNPAHPTRIIDDFEEAAILNNWTYNDYFSRLRLLALSVFKWENLPESMNARFLEMCLFDLGIAAFVNDKNLGFINTKCTPSQTLNIYGIATEYECYSFGYNENYKLDEITIVRNNYDNLPTSQTIELFARRLFNAARTIDININAQKTPVLIQCDDKTRLTLNNLYMKYSGNIPAIFGDKSLNVDALKVLKTDAPFIADKLQLYLRDVWAECLTFLGINNISTEKKERLISSEANANQEHIDISAQVQLLTRQEAAAEFNKKYGTNIQVRKRTFDEIMQSVSRETALNNVSRETSETGGGE